MYRTYNFRPVSPPAPCLVMPGAIAKGLSPIRLKPAVKQTFENSVVLRTVQARTKRQSKNNKNNKNNKSNNKNESSSPEHRAGSGFKEYTFILPSVSRSHNNECIVTPIELLHRMSHHEITPTPPDIPPRAPTQRATSARALHPTQRAHSARARHCARAVCARAQPGESEVVMRLPSRASVYNLTPTVSSSYDHVNGINTFNSFNSVHSISSSSSFNSLQPGDMPGEEEPLHFKSDQDRNLVGRLPIRTNPHTYTHTHTHTRPHSSYAHTRPHSSYNHSHKAEYLEIKTTDHYSHWCDSKSCSSRISSGSLKDNMLGNIDVPNMYTTVTPKSFLPPSPLRSKQFVMPLKLHQLEPQKKPAVPPSDLTVTFVHRKMSSDSSGNNKLCNRNGTHTKQSKNSAYSNKQTNKHTDSASSQAGYPDPLDHAPIAFISRLAEMTGHQADTVRFERTKRGKARTRVS